MPTSTVVMSVLFTMPSVVEFGSGVRRRRWALSFLAQRVDALLQLIRGAMRFAAVSASHREICGRGSLGCAPLRQLLLAVFRSVLRLFQSSARLVELSGRVALRTGFVRLLDECL